VLYMESPLRTRVVGVQNKATLRELAQSRIKKILICIQCNHGEDATVSITDPATDY
jgi:hypothetical protein